MNEKVEDILFTAHTRVVSYGRMVTMGGRGDAAPIALYSYFHLYL